jgi:hypothetical protein
MLRSKKLQEYLKKIGIQKDMEYFKMRGHLVIREEVSKKIVFDRHNLIVQEGKGLIQDLMASLGVSYDYAPSPFNGIVLTKNTASERASDTFYNSVYNAGLDQISDEGVLHVGGAGGGQVSVTHVKGALDITLSGTISQATGNDPANNHINSVCLCTGLNDNYGGPGQGDYVLTNNERLFSRVHVGDLIKTSDKSFNFTWLITIQ